MNATTHAIFGVAALTGTALLVGTEPAIYAYPAAVVAAWLPDVDNPRSRLGNGISRLRSPVLNLVTRPLSWVLRITSFVLLRTVGHRTLTHSLLGLALFALPIWFLFGNYPGVFYALLAGYASHIVADGLNTRGVPLLWPAGGTFRFLPGGFKSGGPIEFFAALVALVFIGFSISLVYPSVNGLF